jgi:hypothetical protein
MENMKQAYEDSVFQIKLRGAVVVENDMHCCRSCASADMASKGVTEETKVAWTFGGQGSELIWHGDRPFYLEEEEDEEEVDEGVWEQPERREEPADGQYWYHSAGGGKDAAECFRQNGFDVEWDGTDDTAVFVKFQ